MLYQLSVQTLSLGIPHDMPTVAILDGMKIQFFPNEHPPPHFHVVYAEYRALIKIDTMELWKGRLPRNKLRSVIEWANPRQAVLFATWAAATANEEIGRID
jgi:hypothetical protein